MSLGEEHPTGVGASPATDPGTLRGWLWPGLALALPFAVQAVRGPNFEMLAPDWPAWAPWALIVAAGIAGLSALGQVFARPTPWGRVLAGFAWSAAGIGAGLDLRAETPLIATALAEPTVVGMLLALCTSVLVTLKATREEIARGIETEMRRG